jgi:hypothetical protein
MRTVMLVVAAWLAGAGAVVLGALLVSAPSAAAPAATGAAGRQVQVSLAGLDPMLQDVAIALRGRFVKRSESPSQRSVTWAAADGTAMAMSIRAEQTSGKPKLIATLEARRELPEMNQSFNLQYLGLQQQMQDESRRFTLLSNVMKTKHDTAEGSIQNVR